MNLSEETQLGHELSRLVAGQPFQPDIEAIGHRARKRHRQRAVAVRGAVSAAAAVVVAGGLFTAVHGFGAGAPGTSAAPRATGAHGPKASAGIAAGDQAPKANATLMSLAAQVTASSASLPGDASLVFQRQVIGGVQETPEYYIYADNGDLYGGTSLSELATAVARHEVSTDTGIVPEVSAARYAATGDLKAAQIKVVDATGGSDLGLGLPPAQRQKVWSAGLAQQRQQAEILKEKRGINVKISPTPPTGEKLQHEVANLVWVGTTEALTDAGGDPVVKAGVLRLLATIPGVTVTKSVTGGQATLTLTAGPAVFGGMAHHEVLIIDAATGAPISLASVDTNKGGLSATETYKVSRVTLADVAKGKF